MTTQLSNFLGNYAQALFVLSFKKIVTELFAVTYMTAVNSAVWFQVRAAVSTPMNDLKQ